MKSLSFRRNAKGFSLIELLLVLGVLALLLVAAFVVYPQVRDRNQANAEVSNLTAIKANVNNLYASTGGNYTGLTTIVAGQARVFPSSMGAVAGSGAAAAASSSWGGGVKVVTSGATTTTLTPMGAISANRSFNITYTAVPPGVCLGMVSGAAGNFQGILVGGVAAANQVITSAGAFDPAKAAGLCAAATPQDIVFYSN